MSGTRTVDKKQTTRARARQIRGIALLQVAFGYPTPAPKRPEWRHLASVGVAAAIRNEISRRGTPADRTPAEKARHRRRKAQRLARRHNR